MPGDDLLQGAASGSGFGPAGALAFGAGGALTSWWMGNAASSSRREASMEAIRRQDRQNAFTLGEATAKANASGVELTGTDSFSKYLADMAEEFRREHDWAVQQANRGASISEVGNAIQGMTGLGSSLFRFASSQNWVQPAAPALGG